MAVVPAVSLIRIARAVARGGLLAVALLPAAAGCVTTNNVLPWTANRADAGPCQIVCIWQNSVQTVPDTMHGGAALPGLACRLYLFGPELGHPMQAEGSVVVDLFDESDGKPVMINRWNVDAQTLRRLASKDFLGLGYTLFLPWDKYRPEISKVRLRTGFQAATATAPLFTENAVTLADVNGVIREGTTPLVRQGPVAPAPGTVAPGTAKAK